MRRSSDQPDFDQVWQAVSAARPPWMRFVGARWAWGLLILLILITLGRSFVLVGSGERAVIFNRFTGTQPYQLDEGLHFVLPWVQMPTVYDIRTHTYSMHAARSEGGPRNGGNDALTALTADGQPVSLDISVLYHVDGANVWRLHREIGPMYVEKIVRPQARSHVRMVVAQYPVIDVYGARRSKIIEEVNSRLKPLFERN